MGLQIPNALHAAVYVRPSIPGHIQSRFGVKSVKNVSVGLWLITLDEALSDSQSIVCPSIRDMYPGSSIYVESTDGNDFEKMAHTYGPRLADGTTNPIQIDFNVLFVRMAEGVL